MTTAEADFFQSGGSFGGTLFDRAYESEVSILGKILLEPEILPQIKTRLKPESFLHRKNRLIYEAMLELHETGIPIDLPSLYDCLEEHGQLEGAGGVMHLTYLPEVVIGEQIARDAEETDRILEHLKNGGKIESEKGELKYES